MTAALVVIALVIGVVLFILLIGATAARRDMRRNPRSGELTPFGKLPDEKEHKHPQPIEDDVDRRLEGLRAFQRLEKAREAEEDRVREIDLREGRSINAVETDEERRLRELREFQRAEKAREAEVENAARGARHTAPLGHEQPDAEIADEPIEKLVAREYVDLQREEKRFKEVADRAKVSRMVGEARDLIVDLNMMYGWQPGEPSIADRMFNVDVESVLGAAVSTGRIDFRTNAMIARMRSFGRAANGGKSEIAKVVATRALLGAGRLTGEELSKMDDNRRLLGDEFADAAGFADQMTRPQERATAKELGVSLPPDLDSARDRRQQQTEMELEERRSQQRRVSRDRGFGR